MRERGLKSGALLAAIRTTQVAPYAGAWIEIDWHYCSKCGTMVAPYAGAWIEIWLYTRKPQCGRVAPYAGAWIEIIFRAGPAS